MSVEQRGFEASTLLSSTYAPRMEEACRRLLAFAVLGTMSSMAAPVGANHEGGNNGFRYECSSAAPRAAIAACTRIIDDQREDSDSRATALQNRGYHYQTIGELDHSIADYTAVLTLPGGRSSKAKVYLNLGQLYVQKGDDDEALTSYGEAVKRDPKLAAAYVDRAAIFIKREDQDHALADLDRAVLLTPQDSEIYISRGSIHAHGGDQDRGNR